MAEGGPAISREHTSFRNYLEQKRRERALRGAKEKGKRNPLIKGGQFCQKMYEENDRCKKIVHCGGVALGITGIFVMIIFL